VTIRLPSTRPRRACLQERLVGLQTDIRGTAAAVQARADAGDPPQSVAASALAGRVAVFRSAADAVMREVELMHPESAAALELLMQGGAQQAA
jgi:hypothetical protein